jgi:hypothetical protein
MKNENKTIDFIIVKLSLIDWKPIKLEEIKNEYTSFELKDFDELIPKMDLEHKLITRYKAREDIGLKTAKLTEFGNEVKKNGSWTSYLIKQKELKDKQEFTDRINLKNKIAENEKLKYEKDLRKLQIDLTDSNLKSNSVSNKSSRVSMYVGVITLIALVTQIGISLYINKQQSKEESLEEELISKTKELTIFHHRIDSLKTLLSNQSQAKKESEEKIKPSKKN